MSEAKASHSDQLTQDSQRIVLRGALTMQSVGAIYRSVKPLAEGAHITIDAGAVTRADSSGLALLTALIRKARENKAIVTLAPLPAGLSSITEIYGLKDILSACE
jgi:phospholipid transport system transporter-binding protein